VRPSEDGRIFDNLSSSHDCTSPAPEKTIGNQWAQSDRFSDLSKLDLSHWPIWPVHEAFGDPKTQGHKPSNEGHGFSRAINSRALTASATEVRFSRATGAAPSPGLDGFLPDGGVNELALPLDVAWQTDVDRHYRFTLLLRREVYCACIWV